MTEDPLKVVVHRTDLVPESDAKLAADADEENKVERKLQPEEKWRNSLYTHGVAEFVLGFVSVVLGLVSLNVAALNLYTLDRFGNLKYENNHEVTYRSQGIWGGCYLLLCGVTAITAKINPTYAAYQANKVLSFFGMLIVLIFAILSVVAAANVDGEMKALVVIHAFLSVIGFVATALLVSHTRAVCCHMPQSEAKL